MGYRTGFFPLAEKHYYLIVERVPESIQEEMRSKTDMLLYDMYANPTLDDGLFYSQINKAFKINYSDEFIDFIKQTLSKYETEVREYHYTNIKGLDLGKLETNTNLNSPFNHGPNSGFVTLQQRFEFEHPHMGEELFNFKYFGRVPYTRSSEQNCMPNPNAGKFHVGSDYFISGAEKEIQHPSNPSPNWIPRLRSQIYELPTSSLYEGSLCIFPPYLLRGATPFYSTKEFKVTYGGQLGYKKPETLI